MAVLAWLSWFVFDADQFVRDTNTRIVGLERARGDIIYLDEVLTMSASMAAATGEVAWIARYRSFEPKLDAASIELVKMENQAFALVRARRPEETRSIL